MTREEAIEVLTELFKSVSDDRQKEALNKAIISMINLSRINSNVTDWVKGRLPKDEG